MPLTISRLWAAIVAGIILTLLVLLAIQTARIEGFRVWPISVKGFKAELAEERAELLRLSTKKNEQKRSTDRNIGETRVIIRDADEVAKRIESAPTAPDCKTPPEIMGADL